MRARVGAVVVAFVLAAGAAGYAAREPLVVTPAGAASSGTAPTAWIDAFCTGTVGWIQGALQGAQTVSDRLSDPAATPADAKQVLVEYLDNGGRETATYLQTMKSTGSPAVANGARIQAQVLRGIAGSGLELVRLSRTAGKIPTGSEARFTRAANRIAPQLAKFSNPWRAALQRATKLDRSQALFGLMSSVPSCAPLVQGTLGGTTPPTG